MGGRQAWEEGVAGARVDVEADKFGGNPRGFLLVGKRKDTNKEDGAGEERSTSDAELSTLKRGKEG